MSEMRRNENGELVKVYPGLETTFTGAMMEKVRDINPQYLKVNVWDDSVSISVNMYLYLNSDQFTPQETQKAPDAPTPEAQAKTTEPDHGFVDGSNVASTIEVVKEGEAA